MRYKKLQSGRLIRLTDSAMDDLEAFERLGLSPDFLSERVQLPLYRSLACFNNNNNLSLDDGMKQFFQRVRDLRAYELPWPKNVLAQPRPYQVQGLRWLHVLDQLSFSGVLADDMGLGKTLQAIALLASRLDDAQHQSLLEDKIEKISETKNSIVADEQPNHRHPALIICPSSILYNWEHECTRFCPSLSVSLIAGTVSEREKKFRQAIDDCVDIVLTSYPLIVRDANLYKNQEWDTIVLDESQTVKNKTTQANRLISQLKRRNVFALSGTPLENRLEELYNLFQLLLRVFNHKSV